MNRLSLYFIRSEREKEEKKNAIIVYVDCRFISQFRVGEKKPTDNHLPIKKRAAAERFPILYVDGF